MMDMLIHMPLSLRDVVSLFPFYHHLGLLKLNQGREGKGSEKSIYMSETWVERVISKSKPLFTLLMVESNTSEVVKSLHPLAQSLLREFEDVFPNDLPSGLPPFRGIEHQIDLIPGAPLPNKLAYRCNANESKAMTSPRVA